MMELYVVVGDDKATVTIDEEKGLLLLEAYVEVYGGPGSPAYVEMSGIKDKPSLQEKLDWFLEHLSRHVLSASSSHLIRMSMREVEQQVQEDLSEIRFERKQREEDSGGSVSRLKRIQEGRSLG